ncbi:periplasmic heavy metal sensor [Escherichia coli]
MTFTLKAGALQQQLVTKRYEYNALLAANPPDSSKINAVAKEMENLRQSLDELRVKRLLRWLKRVFRAVPGMGYGGCGGGGHMGMGHW